MWFKKANDSTQVTRCSGLNFTEGVCCSELTEKETTALHGGSVEVTKRVVATFSECFRCGKANHSSDKCFFRNSKCHGCQKVGHIVKKCPEKEQKPESGKKKWTS